MPNHISLVLLAALSFNSLVHAQPAGKDTCITQMRTITRSPHDSGRVKIEKRAIPGILEKINACGLSYRYTGTYEDKAFEMTIPAYLGNTFHTFGDNTYAINFYDTTNEDRSAINMIVIEYEFGRSEDDFFLQQVEAGKIKANIEKINGKELYLFLNVENKFCGKLYFPNNTYVFYSTPSRENEKHLKNALLSFRWK